MDLICECRIILQKIKQRKIDSDCEREVMRLTISLEYGNFFISQKRRNFPLSEEGKLKMGKSWDG